MTEHDDYGIYVRSTPSVASDANKLFYIEAGDRRVLLQWLGLIEYHEGYDWYRVRTPDGLTGWVRDDVIRFVPRE